MSPEQSAEYVADWRATMEHPCTCPPRPSTDECPRVEECFQAWLDWRAQRHSDGGEWQPEWERRLTSGEIDAEHNDGLETP